MINLIHKYKPLPAPNREVSGTRALQRIGKAGKRWPEAEFLDEILTKVLRVILLATVLIDSHLYSFALRFMFLQTHATSTYFFKLTQKSLTYFYRFTVSVTIHVKKKGGKPDRKPFQIPYDLRNLYKNLKSENF